MFVSNLGLVQDTVGGYHRNTKFNNDRFCQNVKIDHPNATQRSGKGQVFDSATEGTR